MDFKLFVIIGLSILSVWGFISAIINSASNKSLTLENEELSNDTQKMQVTISSQSKQINNVLYEISDLQSKLNTANFVIHSKDVEIAELEGKLSVTSRTNSRLLKEVADDITVNVKAGDDANLKVEKPKRRKPYKKRKPNGGSATNNNKAGEKK
jgi:hypothetical protein